MKATVRTPDLLYAHEEEAPFHRVALTPSDELLVKPRDKPVAVWIPSGYEVVIRAPRGVTLDLAEVVEHHDVVTMDRALREKDRRVRNAERRARRAKRKLRGLDRTGQA